MFPDANGGACTKAGVTNTIRVAAKHQRLPIMDPGGLFLRTGHAVRVTGSQTLSRTGLPEHNVALVARWGSAAVLLLYIRKAPLASTHRLARVALTGWEQNQASAASHQRGSQTTRPARDSSAIVASARNGFPPAAGASRLVAGRYTGVARRRPWSRATSRLLEQSLASAEGQIEGLQRWRTSFVETVPITPAAPVATPMDAVPELWKLIRHTSLVWSAFALRRTKSPSATRRNRGAGGRRVGGHSAYQ